MRIVGGRFRGRLLAAPDDGRTRPTSDRVREAVFNILAHSAAGFSFEDVRVLDLFAGTGALGIEGLSRGASYCLFVEEDAEARSLIRRNIEVFGLAGITKIYRRGACDLGPAGHRGGFGLVFLDPPYGKGLGERALASAAAGGWLAAGAVIVLEERKGTAVDLPAGFTAFDNRTWGDTQVLFARYGSGAS
jgi:16S rRNA (guanine966-N2)-methyltransferase